MAKATQKASKGKAPDPGKATSASTSLAVVAIKSTAMSVDVGPRVIAAMDAANRDTERGKALLAGAQDKRYDAMKDLTLAIVKAAKADKSIVLDAAFGDAKGMARLNDQLGLALGFKVVESVGSGDKARDALRYSPSVRKFINPGKEENPTDEEKRRAGTLRSNFLTMLKKCSTVADELIRSNVEVKADNAAGTLLLSGPTIQKQFGTATVRLDGKQTVPVMDKTGKKPLLKDGKPVEKKLLAKPSFQAIADRAADAHGVLSVSSDRVGGGRKDSRKTIVDPASYIASIAGSLVQAIERIKGEPSAETRKALESVRSAIDKALD